MTAPILLTGFQPFGDRTVDPTALLMERLAGEPGVVTATLSPLYDVCGEEMAALLDRHRPMAVLAFALSERTDSIRIERLAWNRDESAQADAAGTLREEHAIVADGPTAYGSTLPVPRVMRELAMAGLPVTFGDFSGGFLGNHLFYRTRHIIETAGMDAPMGFFHMPPLPDEAQAVRERRGLALERQELAGRVLVDMLRRALAGIG
ncbi:pyroglutamyl-peptidase [Azospirillum agricola]|uniref:pyroglutamyl-peptidase I family protein n=1 Tax=Azospirillum agricola TaxID=1720247 RepID=UPI001AE8895D|nr:pyrrolidone-carboxylate peptidase [Azospirillum agricola]MBP2229868.1 pyroglutamyl-peptidase [Azospirillum agricola]